MTFNPNIPQSTDIPAQSQAQFLTNFSQLNTVFDLDHVTFNNATAANRGKHDKSTYIEQGSDPVTGSNEVALYSKDTGGNTRLYMRQESAGTVIQLSGASPTAAASGSTFLPGALILKWGGKANPLNNDILTFAGGAFPNNVFSITITPVKGDATERSFYILNGSVSLSQFRIATDSTNFNQMYYVAIGN